MSVHVHVPETEHTNVLVTVHQNTFLQNFLYLILVC